MTKYLGFSFKKQINPTCFEYTKLVELEIHVLLSAKAGFQNSGKKRQT